VSLPTHWRRSGSTLVGVQRWSQGDLGVVGKVAHSIRLDFLDASKFPVSETKHLNQSRVEKSPGQVARAHTADQHFSVGMGSTAWPSCLPKAMLGR
jgi:hypothetical protein